MSTPAEQIARFIERHPGEWQDPPPANQWPGHVAVALPILDGVWVILKEVRNKAGEPVAVWVDLARDDHRGIPEYAEPRPRLILEHMAVRGADVLQARGGSAVSLPPWLADPVRWHLRPRAGELLTLAGSSPADVVSAAETVDEALCKRPVVEVTGVLRALMAIGMSCRWATGADEADDYVGFVSRRLDVVAGERDALAAQLAQVQAKQAAQEEYVTARMIAARSVLRGVADEPRASQVTALDAADAYLVDALYRKPKTTETP